MSKSDVAEITPTLIGQSILRKEDASLLTGRGEYVADIILPDMLHVAFVRSPYAHAKITSVNLSVAAAIPGVELSWSGIDVKPLCEGLLGTLDLDNFISTLQPLIAVDEVRFVGEIVAVIVATSRRIAEDAANFVHIDYDELPVVANISEAREAENLANDQVPGNLIHTATRVDDNLDEVLAGASVIEHGVFHNNRISAAPMETRGCVARYEWTSGLLTFWSSTQMPGLFRTLIATTLEILEHTIEIRNPQVGGGFGQKAHLFPEELIACILSREICKPVSWIEDRQEHLLAATHAKDQTNDMTLAFNTDGEILAIRNFSTTDSGAYNNLPWSAAIESTVGTASITGAYKIPLAYAECTELATNKCPIGAYRGVGWTAGQIARETLLDRAARKLKLSPFEIRRRNVIGETDFPYMNATKLLVREGTFFATVNVLERMVDYGAFRKRQAKAREDGKYLGLGVSVFNELSGIGTRALHYIDLPTATHDTTTVRIDPTGTVTVTTSLTSQGQGHATTFAQVAADAFGISVDKVVVRADSTANAWGMGAWASRAAVIGAGSIGRAADIVRTKIKQVAGHMLEVSPEDIMFENDQVYVAGVPTKTIPFADVASAIYFAESAHPPNFDPTLEATAAFDPAEIVLANGGHAAIVEVDIETGIVRVEKVFAVEDCGQMINPMVVEGQIRGGVGQAIGSCLLEEIVHDEHAQIMSTTYMDYLLPTAMDIPDIEIEHLRTPSDLVPGGIKGMGESAMISAPAAVVGAVNDALACFGICIENFPISPERVFAALAAAEA